MGRPLSSFAIAGLTYVLANACNDSPVEPPTSGPPIPTTVATAIRIDLGTLGGMHSYATDINKQEIVVGWSENAAGVSRAFRWTEAAGMTDLGTRPGDQWSRAIGITNTGEVLGVSGRAGAAHGTPVVWPPSGEATPLPIPPLPGAPVMLPADRNALGQVIGGTVLGMFPSHAWIWSQASGVHDIDPDMPGEISESYGSEINEGGTVVGTNRARVCTNPSIVECWHAFVWSAAGGYRDIGIPGSDLASAQVTGNGLNDRGVVVGWTAPSAGSGTQPFRWADSAGFTLLPTFSPGPNTYGYGQSVNLTSTTVGASLDAAIGEIQAAAWPLEGGIVKLNAGDLNPSIAVAVNDNRVIVGWSSLDCCGAANRATLWRLGPGRGASHPMTASRPASTYAPHSEGYPGRPVWTSGVPGGSSRNSIAANSSSIASRRKGNRIGRVDVI